MGTRAIRSIAVCDRDRLAQFSLFVVLWFLTSALDNFGGSARLLCWTCSSQGPTLHRLTLGAKQMASGRPTRQSVYDRMEEAIEDLQTRLGGLPSPAEAEEIWAGCGTKKPTIPLLSKATPWC